MPNNQFAQNVYEFQMEVFAQLLTKFDGTVVGSEDCNLSSLKEEFFSGYTPGDKLTSHAKDEGECISGGEEETSVNQDTNKRKSCETNWAELVISMIILYPDIKTKEDVLNNIERLKTDTRFLISGGGDNIDCYTKDIKIRKQTDIFNYIMNFDVEKFKGVTKVILSGKSFKEFNELKQLNINPNTKKQYEKTWLKSDVYLIYSDKTIGLSIKDSDGATLTNYSVEKILKDIGVLQDFKSDRIEVLKLHFGEMFKYTKSQRPEANNLFYDKENIYFKSLLENIEGNETLFTKELFSKAFPRLHYEVYGYNGKKLKDLNELSNQMSVKKKLIKRNPNYETDTSAKLWFSIYLDNIEEWKFCIRGKVNIYGGSFQILEFTKVHQIP